MKKLEAILPPSQVESVRDALIEEPGVEGLTMSEVWGVGPHVGHTECYRGVFYEVNKAPRLKVEVVVRDECALPAVYAIIQAARAVSPADARIMIVPVTDAVRIRTGQQGVAAIDGAVDDSSHAWDAVPTSEHIVGPARAAAHG